MKSNTFHTGAKILRETKSLLIALQNIAVNSFADIWFVNRLFRPFMALSMGMSCGKGVMLRKGIYYGNLKNIVMGDYVGINREVFFDAYDTITIGSNVGIGFRVIFNTSTHEMGPSQCRVGRLMGGRIVVEDGVWIGAGAYIGPGVTLGQGCVVSAGAIVTRSVEPNVVVAGCPARVIQRLESREKEAPVKL